MASRLLIIFVLVLVNTKIYASSFESFEVPQIDFTESSSNLGGSYYESGNLVYNSALDPNYNCDSNDWWCSTKFGLTKAFESGTNGFFITGYAYHDSRGLHAPTGYATGLNELVYGTGYARSFYNPQYNSEYTLYAVLFADSYYKPETQVGYMYQKYFDMNDSGSLKWGIGYSPFVLTKVAYTANAPMPLPGLGVLTSIKASNVDVMLFYFSVYMLAVRVDL